MLLFRIAFRNLFRHRLKTILIGSLIAGGAGLLFCANAVFESTSKGLETSFIGSLTGDFAITAKDEESFGIFGSEVPIVSEYQSIPSIADFRSVSDTLNAETYISSWTPIVSAAAQINVGGYSIKGPLFGVEPSSYFSVCTDLTIEKGDPSALSHGGVFFNTDFAKAVEKAIKRPLMVGEHVVFSMFSRGNFKIRRGTFAGIYRYPAPTDVMKRIVLADPTIIRALNGYTLGYALAQKDGNEDAQAAAIGNLDDLFFNAEDSVLAPAAEMSLDNLEDTLADTTEREAMVMTDQATWNFVLARIRKDVNPDTARWNIAQALARKQVEARVLDWKTAAGSTALMLFAVRAAFNVGIGILILGASLIVMNALVISVLERTNEIGTMRALGAGRGFIRTLFIVETLILTVIAAALGIAGGAVLSALFARHGIPLTNPLLITLFGGTSVRPVVEPYALLTHFLGAILIASFAWIYPVSLALQVEPVSAMAER